MMAGTPSPPTHSFISSKYKSVISTDILVISIGLSVKTGFRLCQISNLNLDRYYRILQNSVKLEGADI
jgi:hypothetical protein